MFRRLIMSEVLTKEYKKIDPYTGDEFYAKYKKQIFETVENRIAYNNSRSDVKEKQKKKQQLNSNYRILEEITIEKKNSLVTKLFLDKKGFDFNRTNGEIVSKDNHLYLRVWDYCFRLVDDMVEIGLIRGDGKNVIIKYNQNG